MIKEIKNLIFLVIIVLFIFFTCRYYFSDAHVKKSYRALANISQKIELYSENFSTLENDTSDIIEYIKNTQSKKKKKYYFWELIDKND